jgi:hypothetical protein
MYLSAMAFLVCAWDVLLWDSDMKYEYVGKTNSPYVVVEVSHQLVVLPHILSTNVHEEEFMTTVYVFKHLGIEFCLLQKATGPVLKGGIDLV